MAAHVVLAPGRLEDDPPGALSFREALAHDVEGRLGAYARQHRALDLTRGQHAEAVPQEDLGPPLGDLGR
jgi:hypothetical protein